MTVTCIFLFHRGARPPGRARLPVAAAGAVTSVTGAAMAAPAAASGEDLGGVTAVEAVFDFYR